MPRYTQNSKTKRPQAKKGRLPIYITVGAVLIVLIITVLELTNTTYIFHKKPVPAVIPVSKSSISQSTAKNQATGSTTDSASKNSNTSSTSDTSTKSTGSTQTNATTPLAQPFGNFVSNHVPGQSGSSFDEQSVCDTTPGATCYVQLTNTDSGVTTKLPTQTVGSDGSTIWNWNAQSAGLTSGKWQITAFASLNGQTKSTDDPTKLVMP